MLKTILVNYINRPGCDRFEYVDEDTFNTDDHGFVSFEYTHHTEPIGDGSIERRVTRKQYINKSEIFMIEFLED